MSASEAKILVAAYSRSGTTSKIAAEIARRLSADIEEIRDIRSRWGLLAYFRSAREAMRKIPGDIFPPVKKWRDYDLVVIGTPVWAGHVASPIRAYVSQCGEPSKRFAFFCTMGGRGAESVFAELTQLTRMTPVATLALTDEQIAQQRYGDLLEAFARRILNPTAESAPQKVELASVA